MNRKDRTEKFAINSLAILIIVMFMLLGLNTTFGQTIHIQGTNWAGDRYIVSYPINTNLNNFNAIYDRAGYNAYYVPPRQSFNPPGTIKVKPINKKVPTPKPYNHDPNNFQFKPNADFWDNTGVFDKD